MGRRARLILVAVVAAAAVLGTAGIVTAWQRPTPVEASLAVVDDDDRFTTAMEASDAFAEIAGRLAEVDCDADRDRGCARTHRAAAWSKVAAVMMAQCTPPAVFDARAGLARYLRGRSELPSLPRCGARRQSPSS